MVTPLAGETFPLTNGSTRVVWTYSHSTATLSDMMSSTGFFNDKRTIIA